ncbi:hypothetical protein BX661DRAFT_179291 [Kickxella alabastrina]|uniref:uncharacterized protein n=1 Tax=Kickxella alabastrina TaxID=61397 RepID=UPI00221EF8EE|nr:uncharacterized protein BX661DRAFT_179291 [Kickxella alabastrina]KAI7833168.1 hypothetical protein BX661DRAFT_179291 [Kickxella alabastrina]
MESTAEQVKGAAKEKLGQATADERVTAEGHSQCKQTKGSVEKYDELPEKETEGDSH